MSLRGWFYFILCMFYIYWLFVVFITRCQCMMVLSKNELKTELKCTNCMHGSMIIGNSSFVLIYNWINKMIICAYFNLSWFPQRIWKADYGSGRGAR